jgi:hypothetical protein
VEARANRPPEDDDPALPGEVWLYKANPPWTRVDVLYVYGVNPHFVPADVEDEESPVQRTPEQKMRFRWYRVNDRITALDKDRMASEGRSFLPPPSSEPVEHKSSMSAFFAALTDEEKKLALNPAQFQRRGGRPSQADARARQEHEDARSLAIGDILASLVLRAHDEPLSAVKSYIQAAIVDITRVSRQYGFPRGRSTLNDWKNTRRDGK